MEDHEELTTSCANSEHYNAPITPTENNDIGNTHDATLTEGESSLDVLKFFHQSCYDRATISGTIT